MIGCMLIKVIYVSQYPNFLTILISMNAQNESHNFTVPIFYLHCDRIKIAFEKTSYEHKYQSQLKHCKPRILSLELLIEAKLDLRYHKA